MKATAVIKGDHTVGIPDYGFEIDFGEFEFGDDEHREAVRQKVAELIMVAFDEGVYEVYFDDDPEGVYESYEPEDWSPN